MLEQLVGKFVQHSNDECGALGKRVSSSPTPPKPQPRRKRHKPESGSRRCCLYGTQSGRPPSNGAVPIGARIPATPSCSNPTGVGARVSDKSPPVCTVRPKTHAHPESVNMVSALISQRALWQYVLFFHALEHSIVVRQAHATHQADQHGSVRGCEGRPAGKCYASRNGWSIHPRLRTASGLAHGHPTHSRALPTPHPSHLSSPPRCSHYPSFALIYPAHHVAMYHHGCRSRPA